MYITCLICKIRPYLTNNNIVHVKNNVHSDSCTASSSQGEAERIPNFKERTLKSRLRLVNFNKSESNILSWCIRGLIHGELIYCPRGAGRGTILLLIQLAGGHIGFLGSLKRYFYYLFTLLSHKYQNVNLLITSFELFFTFGFFPTIR